MTDEDLEVLRLAHNLLHYAAGGPEPQYVRVGYGASRDALRAIIARETEGRADG